MANDPNIQQYAQYVKEEAERIEDYINSVYSIKVPPPVPPTTEDLGFLKIAGFETISFLIPSVSLALFSAIRTSGFFFIEQFTLFQQYEKLYNFPSILTWVFSFIVMFASILGFEGMMLARGIKAGRKQSENHVSWAGTWLTAGIIVLAAIYAGIGLLTIPAEIKMYIDLFMILATGVSGGIITFYGGNDIGFAYKEFEVKKANLKKSFSDAYQSWREAAVKSYNTARNGIMKNIGAMSSIQSSTSQPSVPQTDQKKKSKSELAYDFVQEYYMKNTSLPTNQKVADASGVSIGSAYKAIGDFVISNKEELIFKNIVSQDDVNKLLNKRGIENTSNTYEISVQKITDFIRSNGAFPVSEEITRLDIPLDDIARFVLENKEDLLKNNLTNDKTIEDAQKHLNK